jgi:hypothetical protein
VVEALQALATRRGYDLPEGIAIEMESSDINARTGRNAHSACSQQTASIIFARYLS